MALPLELRALEAACTHYCSTYGDGGLRRARNAVRRERGGVQRGGAVVVARVDALAAQTGAVTTAVTAAPAPKPERRNATLPRPPMC